MPFAVELDVRLGTDGCVGVVRHGLAGNCGWHLHVEPGRVAASVVGAQTHFADVPLADSQWHSVRWSLTPEWSSVAIDGLEVSRVPVVGAPTACPDRPTLLGPFTDATGEQKSWCRGDADSLRIGASSWNFEDAPGSAFADEAAAYPGNWAGDAATACR